MLTCERCRAALLDQAEEKAVAVALSTAEQAVKPALAREDFAGAMAAFAGLRGPLDAFFDKVTVNVTESEAVTAEITLPPAQP